MTPIDCYRTYLAFKNHFSKPSFDYFKYNGKTKATPDSFHKRKDRYFFEKMSRQKSDQEIKEYFLANFIECDNPQKLWIGEIINSGNDYYTQWKTRSEKLTYQFREEISHLFDDQTIDDVIKCKIGNHSKLLKEHMINKVSIETLVILDMILHFVDDYDKMLDDPIWQFYSFKIKKYRPFLNIDSTNFKKILKEKLIHGTD
jgi:hypothetical protein